MDIMIVDFVIVFFFKQKTAYEMRISDWSSDVCSSDLLAAGRLVVIVERLHPALARHRRAAGKHRIEQLLLVVEIIIEQRVMDADALGDVLERHAVQAVSREQIFGGIEDLLGRFRAADRKSTRMNSSH